VVRGRNRDRPPSPDVDRVRPGMCPCCGRAGNPTGKQLGIIGHGLRERQQRGPLVASGAPQMVTVQVRRYLPFEKRSANLFFQLVTRRYERGSMLITTNQMVTQ
jgi:IstB-like ATP binding protein